MSKDLALLVLRLAGAGLAYAHGWGKVVSLSLGQGDRFIAGVAELGFPAPGLFAWASALAEFLGGLCVALGLGSRIAAGFAAFNMSAAAFGRHKAHIQLFVNLGLVEIPADTVKAWGNPELALLYLAVSLTVLLVGPGRFALDSLIGGKKP